MDFSLGYHVLFFTFSFCILVFKKTQNKHSNSFTGQGNQVFSPFHLMMGYGRRDEQGWHCCCILSLYFSLLTTIAVVQIEHSGMCTGKILLEPHDLYREVGPGLNLLSLKILLYMPFSCSQAKRLSFRKKKKLLYFYGVCSVLWSCHFVIFFTLGNFRPWGAHVHDNSWTRETKKKRNLSKSL